jgi:predicted Rossmann fold flavoprotein
VRYDVIVLGGGAAGLFCALTAGRRGRRVLVLERNREAGRKILISGGGRCNFTNLHCGPEHFLSANPAFARSALARFTPRDFIDLVERHGIAYHEKTLGQLFCDGSSRQIVDMLLAECRAAGVVVVTGSEVGDVEPGFTVATSAGTFAAPRLVVATGGLSIPKIGATGLGYRVAERHLVPVVPPRPALVPLVLDEADRQRWGDLAGVAADSVVTAGGASFRERLLVTHRGLSGPAILQASSYWRAGRAVGVDLLPGVDFASELTARRARGDTTTTRAALAEHLPRRLADRWFDVMATPSVIATTGNRRVAALSAGLHDWRV